VRRPWGIIVSADDVADAATQVTGDGRGLHTQADRPAAGDIRALAGSFGLTPAEKRVLEHLQRIEQLYQARKLIDVTPQPKLIEAAK
jgi:hypothetical protein